MFEVLKSPTGAPNKIAFRLSDQESQAWKMAISEKLFGLEETPVREYVMRLEGPALESWILFWKCQESETRILLAHPEPEEWVVTISMGKTAYERFFHSLESGESLSLSDCKPLHRFSNFDLELSR